MPRANSKAFPTNQILEGDCVERLAALPAGSVDLVFADPPFNIGYDYDIYHDKKEARDYLAWSRQWIAGVHRALKPAGTFWLAIGDEYAAELKVLSQELGFRPRSWVIWYYTFGVNCTTKFSRSHAHLFYFVKDAKRFTFRAKELENRIPSARQLVYGDSRANPDGRLPDDTWVLRPQDLADCFTSAEDTWYFPRVAGTFKERAGFHGCQMPEQLLGRIIRTCSEPGELVLDPFSGSASTSVVAKKLGRKFLGFDLSPEYVRRGQSRLEAICVGDDLEGAAEPTKSAPATPRKSSVGKRAKNATPPDDGHQLASYQVKIVDDGLRQAFERCAEGYSVDRLVADPTMNTAFIEECQALGMPGEPVEWNRSLLAMRKSGLLAKVPTTRRTERSWEDCDDYLFASEIAWRQMIDDGCDSLDGILCDPKLARQFDEIARRWAPGYEPLDYRWAALKLRKCAKAVRARAKLIDKPSLGKMIPIKSDKAFSALPDAPGVYLVKSADTQLYAGEASHLRNRLTAQFGSAKRDLLKRHSATLTASFYQTDSVYTTRLAYQRQLVVQYQPRYNLPAKQLA